MGDLFISTAFNCELGYGYLPGYELIHETIILILICVDLFVYLIQKEACQLNIFIGPSRGLKLSCETIPIFVCVLLL